MCRIKPTLLALSATSIIAATGAAWAQTAAPAKAPEPAYTLSYNLGAVTEYRYRGVSQSARKPALQGGVDFAHKSGFYAGAWASTIQWIKDSPAAPASAKGPLEVDLYGGYKGEVSKDLSYDVGALQYWYAGNNLGNVSGFANPNTLELYGALTMGPVTTKYSRSTTNLFGTVNSKNSGYLDLSASFDLGSGYSLAPHLGAQNVHNAYNYNDYSLALNKDINGLVLSAALVGTNKKNFFVYPGSGSTDMGKANLVLGLKKNL